ncbi:MAG: isoprenylcysteine carboxylmethyltransferase family protein [Rhodobacteraceae bacterium]|nr:isoprenylcysteine carboxylmethyltransferase family protein [Paracoccaceae bacterium]
MSHLRGFPDLPPVWAFGVFLMQLLLSRFLPLAELGGWARTAGWLLLAAGFGLAGWAAFWFWRKRTRIEPRQVPRALIVEGPYRVNRNPIYTGMLLSLVGTGLLSGALSALLLAAVFPPIVTARFIRGEEDGLRTTFGAEAERYIARTRRW